jgi:hypothetical protein
LINAVRGLPPATISVPDKIPKNSEIITSFVINANAMVRTGGIIPQIPKLAIILSPLLFSQFSASIAH